MVEYIKRQPKSKNTVCKVKVQKHNIEKFFLKEYLHVLKRKGIHTSVCNFIKHKIGPAESIFDMKRTLP